MNICIAAMFHVFIYVDGQRDGRRALVHDSNHGICQGIDSANKNGRLLHSRQDLAYSSELVITYDAHL